MQCLILATSKNTVQWLRLHYFGLLRSHRPSKAAAVPRSNHRYQNLPAVIAAEIRRQIRIFCIAVFPGEDIPAPAEGSALFPAAVWGVGEVAVCAFGMRRAFCFGYKNRRFGEHIGYTSRSPA